MHINVDMLSNSCDMVIVVMHELMVSVVDMVIH
jgi:hypothetical protein